MNRSKWKCYDCKTSKQADAKKKEVGDDDFNRFTSYIDKKFDNLDKKFDNLGKELLKTLRKEIAEMLDSKISSELQGIKDQLLELKPLEASINFISEVQEDIKQQLSLNTVAIKNLQTDNMNIKSNLNTIQLKLREIDQQNRSKNIEIQMLPEQRNENLSIVFKKLCDVVSYPITTNGIISCHRVPKINNASSRPRNIVITMLDTNIKDDLLSAVRRYNKNKPNDKLNAALLGVSPTASPVYVCEHLSPDNKELHAATRSFSKEQNYKFVWIRNGRIFTRKNESSPPIHIKNREVLASLVNVNK
jgi:Baculovirus FP protein